MLSRYSQIFENLGQCQQHLCKVNSIDLISKQEALNTNPRRLQYYFTWKLDHDGNLRMLFVLREVKENIFDFWQGTVNCSYFKIRLPVPSVINMCYKELHFRCAGIPWFAPDKDLSDRNRQFEFKQALTKGMLRKS